MDIEDLITDSDKKEISKTLSERIVEEIKKIDITSTVEEMVKNYIEYMLENRDLFGITEEKLQDAINIEKINISLSTKKEEN